VLSTAPASTVQPTTSTTMGKTMAREGEITQGLLTPHNSERAKSSSPVPHSDSIHQSNDFSLSDAYSFYNANKIAPSPPDNEASGTVGGDAALLLCLASAAETLDRSEPAPKQPDQPAQMTTSNKVLQLHQKVSPSSSTDTSTDPPVRSSYTGIRYPHEHQHLEVRTKKDSHPPRFLAYSKGSYPKSKITYTQIYKGVTIRPSRKYQAQIFYGKGQTVYLGVWLLETDAGYVFDQANKYFGGFEQFINFRTKKDYLEARQTEVNKRGLEILKRMKSYMKTVEEVDAKVNKILGKFSAKLGKKGLVTL
jgi:hypothetical protein